jgi:hypothetical protein
MSLSLTVIPVLSATRAYKFKRGRGVEYPAIKAAEAAHQAMIKLTSHWLSDPWIAQRAHAASAQMRRSLVAGFARPAGSKARQIEHRVAWRATRILDKLVAKAVMEAQGGPIDIYKISHAAQRAVDRADILISALPGVDVKWE